MDFYEESHLYRKDGIQYTPVTTFLKKFKPEFPKGLIAEQCSRRDGIPAETIISKWDLNAEISTLYGQAIHKGIEYWIKHGETGKLNHIQKAIKAFSEKYDRKDLFAEVIVFSEEYKLAGTIDQIRKLGDKRVALLDVKTNGELNDKPRGKFLPPMEHLPFSKINEYRLQLSVYKHLLELKGVTVESIALEHWDGDSFKTIVLEPITNIKQLCQNQPK